MRNLALVLCISALSALIGYSQSVPITDINFDTHPAGTIANTVYLDQGVEFSRDDGSAVLIYDWTGRTTTTGPNVVATVAFDGGDGYPQASWSTNLNLVFTYPTYEVGAFFGNDQVPGAFDQMVLSIFDKDGALLDYVAVAPDNNTSVDQFIGLSSSVPFFKARFENVGGSGAYAVVLDDVTFASAVPDSSSKPRATIRQDQKSVSKGAFVLRSYPNTDDGNSRENRTNDPANICWRRPYALLLC